MMIICMVCRRDGKGDDAFSAPNDFIGQAIITEHVKEEHPVEYQQVTGKKA